MKRIVATIACTLALAMSFALADAQPWRWQGTQQNTYGWQLMTPQERIGHQAKMRSFTDYAACTEYVNQHHQQMAARAKEKGYTVPLVRRNPCDMLKERGMLR